MATMIVPQSLKVSALAISCLLVTQPALAELIGGIDFPQGSSSFADSVIRYLPNYSGGPIPTEPGSTESARALGVPNYSASAGYVTLGRGGLIELAFVDNELTNNGDTSKDIHIFEVGPDVEDTFVAIRPTALTLSLLAPSGDANSDGFFEIGKVFGSTSSIDIDFFFPGFASGVLAFDAVQLIDDRNEGQATGATVGADIDAVGAISSVPVNVPIPPTWALLLPAFLIRKGGRRRQGHKLG